MKFHRSAPPFQLAALMLSGCNLDNGIVAEPNFLGTQHHLEVIDLSNNNLKGRMPTWILENLVTLVHLDLANNSLVGSTLDLMWQQQSNHGLINISMNHFFGQVPRANKHEHGVPKSTSSRCFLQQYFWSLATPSLCNIGNLLVIDVSYNGLIGEVPTCLFTTQIPRTLKLSNNNLGGLIFGGSSDLSRIAAIHFAS